MQEDIRYIKANPEFNKKLNELLKMQKGTVSKQEEEEWGFDFDQDSKDTGLPKEDVKLFVAILGELIFHSVANGATLSKEEKLRLCVMKFNQIRKEQNES
jgi:hypothetical protein